MKGPLQAAQVQSLWQSEKTVIHMEKTRKLACESHQNSTCPSVYHSKHLLQYRCQTLTDLLPDGAGNV